MDAYIFEFSEYKQYLTEKLGGAGKRKGQRLAMAQFLGCQPTFVSQVLNDNAHFSMEQAEKISRFLGLSEDEREYLFLLIQKERAGSTELTAYYAEKIGALLAKRQILLNRLGQDTALTPAQQSVYYSSWYYAAIHIAVTIPTLQSIANLAEFFKLPVKKVSEILEYLNESGLVSLNQQGHYTIGQARIRLGKNSHHLKTHHANWRQQAIESLDRETNDDLHYSAVLSLSAKDRIKVKDMILDALKKQLEVTDASAEEELVAYNIDLFSLKK